MVRIVSLSPSLTEILTALKAESHLVGVSDACEVKGGRPERVGSPKAIQLKRIEALSPEWILADSRENRPEEIHELQRKGKTKLFEVNRLEDVSDCIAELGRLVGKRREAKQLNETIQNEIQTSKKVFEGREKKRTVLLLWDVPFLTVNFDTYPSRLLEVSGGVNVFRAEPLREFPVEVEDMIEKNPEVLLLPGEPAPFRSKHITRFRRYRVFSKIPIHLIEGKLLARYGVQTTEALKRLRKIYETLQ